MIRQLILLTGIIIFLTNCSTTPQRGKLTSEEDTRFVLDMTACKIKPMSLPGVLARKGGITWERKCQEIYDYCMKNKEWDLK